MSHKEKLEALIEKNGGILLTREATGAGIPRVYIAQLVAAGTLGKQERGVYIAKDSFDDVTYRLQTKYSSIIFSHDTALFLHDLTDRDPLQYAVTVPAGYNPRNIKDNGVKVYSIKKDLYGLGVYYAKTPCGRDIKAYDMERTICDILRSRKQMDISMVTDALKRYVKRKDKNLPRLMRYAESFNVSNILRGYMEVLL